MPWPRLFFRLGLSLRNCLTCGVSLFSHTVLRMWIELSRFTCKTLEKVSDTMRNQLSFPLPAGPSVSLPGLVTLAISLAVPCSALAAVQGQAWTGERVVRVFDVQTTAVRHATQESVFVRGDGSVAVHRALASPAGQAASSARFSTSRQRSESSPTTPLSPRQPILWARKKPPNRWPSRQGAPNPPLPATSSTSPSTTARLNCPDPTECDFGARRGAPPVSVVPHCAPAPG